MNKSESIKAGPASVSSRASQSWQRENAMGINLVPTANWLLIRRKPKLLPAFLRSTKAA